MNERSTELRSSARFDVRRRLGSGAAGLVYEAFDRERHEAIAIKTVRVHDPASIALLKNEFRAVQDVRHANLVELGELFEEAGEWFFTMELVDGVPLIDYVRPGGAAFDEARVRDAFAQVARALAALHAAQIVHRDVKPSNVLVTREGRAVVLDFGIAADLAGRKRLFEEDDVVVGTVPYMAPEQLDGHVTATTDWYALGAMLYEALTGEVPFAGPMHELIVAKSTAEPPPPASKARGVPEDLDRLCADLLRLDPAARPSDAEILERLGAEEEGARLASSGRHAVFVGRASEMSALDAALAEVAVGRAASVVIEGESGVGKSYLVGHFLTRLAAERPDAVLLEARCYERESVPYKAVDGIVDDLRLVLERMTPEERLQVLPAAARGLAQLFPALADALATRTAVTQEEIPNAAELRLRAFAVFRELLGRLAARGPLVLSIDDLQWADADGLALLGEVLRPPDPPPLLLIATLRTVTDVRGAKAPSPVALLPGTVRTVRLSKLAAGEAAELVTKLLEGSEAPMPEAEVRALVEDAGGHPLFLDELVRSRSKDGARGATVRLDDALWASVERLDGDARRLVEASAVAGLPLEPKVLGVAAALSPAQLFHALSTTRAAHLARTSRTGAESTVDTYHDRVRASVLARLGPAARAEWHGRLALAIEGEAGADPELLAGHWAGAGRPDRALPYTLRAASRAEAALAFDHAARLYRQALAAGASGDQDRSIRARLAEALTNDGRPAEAAEVRLALAEGAPPLEALDLRRRAAEQFLCGGVFDRGQALMREVLAATKLRYPASSAAVLGGMAARRAWLRLRGTHFRERDAADVDPAALLRVDTLRSAAAGFGMTDLVRGASFQTQATLAALELGEPHRVLRALAFECIFLTSALERNSDRIEALVAEVTRLAGRLGTAEAMALASAARGYVAFANMDLPAARAAFVEAEALFRDRCVGLPFELASMRVFVYCVLIYLGARRELARRAEPILREALHRGDLFSLNNLKATALPFLALADHEPDRSRAMLDEVERSLTHRQLLLQHVFALASRVQTELYVGDAAAAHRVMEQAWPAFERSMLLRLAAVRTFAHGFRARAALALAARSPKGREPLLRVAARSLEQLGKIGSPWSAADRAMVEAFALRLGGRHDEALASMKRAADGFRALGMGLFAAASSRRYGEWLGGDAGAGLVQEADRGLRAEGVREPARMVCSVAPEIT